MAKWKYLIIDIEDGSIVGTDDLKAATEFGAQEANIVVEVETQLVANFENYDPDSGEWVGPVFEGGVDEQRLYKF